MTSLKLLNNSKKCCINLQYLSSNKIPHSHNQKADMLSKCTSVFIQGLQQNTAGVSKLLYYSNLHLLSSIFYLGSKSTWKKTTGSRRRECGAGITKSPRVQLDHGCKHISANRSLSSWACFTGTQHSCFSTQFTAHFSVRNKCQDSTYLLILFIYNLQSSPGVVSDCSSQPPPTCPSQQAWQSFERG